MLSTIVEIESPKDNRSKEQLQSGSEEAEKTTELTLEGQQKLAEIFKTLKDTNKITESEFTSFTIYLKTLEEKKTFEELIHSLKVGDCSIGSYNDSQERSNGNQSDSFVNIVSELRRRNICLSLQSCSESSSNSNQANTNEGGSKQEEGRSYGGSSNQAKGTFKQSDNALNLREFLTKELEKRVNITPNSYDSISSSLMKSLFGTITDKQKTSTPMYDTSSTDKTMSELFSISTVTVNSN